MVWKFGKRKKRCVIKESNSAKRGVEINGPYYFRSLRGARKIKYFWAFNKIHRLMAVDSAQRNPLSI